MPPAQLAINPVSLLLAASLACQPSGNAGPELQKAIFERSKPHCDVAVLGQEGPGATLLASVLVDAQARKGLAQASSAAAPERAMRGLGVTGAQAHVELETERRHYAVVSFPSRDGRRKTMIAGAPQIDGAILFVSVPEGITPVTRESVVLARAVGVAALVVFLAADEVASPTDADAVEAEVRELLTRLGFAGADTPVVRGSAQRMREALQAGAPDLDDALEPAARLLEAVDAHVPTPSRAVEKPFLMPVEDVFSIQGRGTVATGRIESGSVRSGDALEIVGIGPTRKTTCAGVEMFQMTPDAGVAGDNVGLVLRGIEKQHVERGMVLARPGTIQPRSVFESTLYVLSEEEGGRHAPFSVGYRPQFYFRTTEVTGAVVRLAGLDDAELEQCQPGDAVDVRVELVTPVALNTGVRFAVREGGRTVGAGCVTRIVE